MERYLAYLPILSSSDSKSVNDTHKKDTNELPFLENCDWKSFSKSILSYKAKVLEKQK